MTTHNARARLWASLTVAFLAFASSVPGLFNGFTYDDRYIVEMNPAMHELGRWWHGFAESYWPPNWGADGYRPITILFFKIEYVLGHGSPFVFHAANIVLYSITAVLVFEMARRLLPFEAAWLAAALFAVHPVHVEAVANVVGQSELLVGVCLFLAVALYLRDRQAGPLRASTAAWILLLYALGCFSKEHAIVLPAILVAAELTVLGSDDELRSQLRNPAIRIFYLTLVLVAVAFMAVRGRVLSGHGVGGFTPFTPFQSLNLTGVQRTLTAVGVVPQWVRLLLFPVHLASEYSPPDIPIAQGVELYLLPGFLLLVATIAIAFALRRREPVISFGIAFLCVTLLPSSNFLVPAGIVLAERTLFSPSAGAMLAVAGAIVAFARYRGARSLRRSAPALIAVMLVLAAGIARSAVRSRVWKDNGTLFHQAVADVPDSYRAHYMLGAWDFEQHDIRHGEAEYREALHLFPYDPAVSFNMAEQYRLFGLCEPALPLYKWTRELDPNFPYGRYPYALCLYQTGHFADAKRMAFVALAAGADVRSVRGVVAAADSMMRAKAMEPAAGGRTAAGQIGSGKVP
jgi:hypothetical protein